MAGPGADLRRLQDVGLRVVGLDRSTGLLRLADPLPRTRADLTALPFRAGSLDGIWSHASLLHIDASDLLLTLAGWDRVLAPGGVVGISTSLGGDSGWELVPAGPCRVPVLESGQQRWFVHHRQGQIEAAVADIGWGLQHRSVRSSHREVAPDDRGEVGMSVLARAESADAGRSNQPGWVSSMMLPSKSRERADRPHG